MAKDLTGAECQAPHGDDIVGCDHGSGDDSKTTRLVTEAAAATTAAVQAAERAAQQVAAAQAADPDVARQLAPAEGALARALEALLAADAEADAALEARYDDGPDDAPPAPGRAPVLDRYVVIENTPGYLPDDDSPAEPTDWRSALADAQDRVARLLDDEWATWAVVGEPVVQQPDPADPGSVGYFECYLGRGGPHDLGRVVTVEALDDEQLAEYQAERLAEQLAEEGRG